MRLATVLAQMSEAFDDAEFPDHLGLKAAGLIDRWIEDSRVLREATDLYDQRSHWSDVPTQHLLEGSLGASYLDPVGFVFYLPAYMQLALLNASYPYQGRMLAMMSPPSRRDLYELSFLPRMRLMGPDRIRAGRAVLRYVFRQTELDEVTPWIHDKAGECLAHPFWQGDESV